MTTEVFQDEFDHLKEVFQDESCEDPMTDWDILLYMVDKADSGDYPKHLTTILRKKAISRGWYIPISKEECDRTQTFPKKRKVYNFVLGGIRYVWDGPNSLETENEYVERLKSGTFWRMCVESARGEYDD